MKSTSRRLGICAVALGVALAVRLSASDARGRAASVDAVAWSAVFRMIELRWPAVQQLSTIRLARHLERHEPVLLIDSRAQDEYLVSHLPGAVWAETPAQLRAAVRATPDTQLIVIYCSVGVRSSKAAAMLMRHD